MREKKEINDDIFVELLKASTRWDGIGERRVVTKHSIDSVLIDIDLYHDDILVGEFGTHKSLEGMYFNVVSYLLFKGAEERS